jgi:hypothetical protein
MQYGKPTDIIDRWPGPLAIKKAKEAAAEKRENIRFWLMVIITIAGLAISVAAIIR